MKNLLLIFSFFLISIGLRAQGNLQFNQVLNLEFQITGNGSSIQTAGDLIVPSGKVWKIESVSGYRTGTNGVGAFVNLIVMINNAPVFATATDNAPVKLPFWLSAGTHKLKWHTPNSSASGDAITLSVIEYNIIP